MSLVLNPEGYVSVEQLFCINSTIDRTENVFTWVKTILTYWHKNHYHHQKRKFYYLTFHRERSLWKSASVITSSETGGDGAGGGYAARKARNRLQSSTLYKDEEIFGSSMKLHRRKLMSPRLERKRKRFLLYNESFLQENWLGGRLMSERVIKDWEKLRNGLYTLEGHADYEFSCLWKLHSWYSESEISFSHKTLGDQLAFPHYCFVKIHLFLPNAFVTSSS